MEKKLYEILKAEKGVEVEIKGKKLNFKRFTLASLATLNRKQIDLEKLGNDDAASIDKTATAIWEQLDQESQEEFKGIEVFKEVLDFETFSILVEGFQKTVEEASITEKK